MRNLLTTLVVGAIFLVSCRPHALHPNCTRENAIDGAIVGAYVTVPSGFHLSQYQFIPLSSVKVDGDEFTVDDTAKFNTLYEDSMMDVPFHVVLKCGFDGEMERTEQSYGTPITHIDTMRLRIHIEMINLNRRSDSLYKVARREADAEIDKLDREIRELQGK